MRRVAYREILCENILYTARIYMCRVAYREIGWTPEIEVATQGTWEVPTLLRLIFSKIISLDIATCC